RAASAGLHAALAAPCTKMITTGDDTMQLKRNMMTLALISAGIGFATCANVLRRQRTHAWRAGPDAAGPDADDRPERDRQEEERKKEAATATIADDQRAGLCRQPAERYRDQAQLRRDRRSGFRRTDRQAAG